MKMKKKDNLNKYRALIAKIQRRRRIVLALDIVALIVFLFSTGTNTTIYADGTIVTKPGLHPVWQAFFALLILFVGVIAYAAVSSPILGALNQECDPEKHLVLNQMLNKPKNQESQYAAAYLYLGVFPKAIEYADQLIAKKKVPFVLGGLLYRARCAFFLQNYDLLKQDVAQYEFTLQTAKKLKQKARLEYQKILPSLHLLCALADEDTERIETLRHATMVWGNFKITEGYVNYIKGLAALQVNDKKEAIYRLMSVADCCPKTVLGRLANERLETLSAEETAAESDACAQEQSPEESI